MSVHKDKKTGKWYVSCRYDNWDGARKQKMKRGFETKREAQAWEREFLQIKSSNLDMTFGAFLKLYYNDRKSRIKKNTFFTKSHIIENKILPYFKNRKMSEIKATDIIAWQNKIMSERDVIVQPNTRVYKALRNQMAEILAELKRINNSADIDSDLLDIIHITAQTYNGLAEKEKS